MNIAEVHTLSGGYGKNTIFRDVSFVLKPGEVLAILGQNGSGKSTLLKTLAGLLPPQGGQVRLNTLNNASTLQPHRLVEAGISYCPQAGLVLPELSIQEHLLLATRHLGESDARIAREEGLSTFPALNDLLHQRAGTLSGGQSQQLTLAILTAQRTNLWLLDEPTAGLAPDLVKATTEFLHQRVQQHHTTMILVEHDLDVALALADRILVLREGTVARMIDNVQALEQQLDHEQIYN